MSFDRAKVAGHAEAYWWRPCEDGVVYIKTQGLNVGQEANRLKLKGYGGAFLWYSRQKLEGLFLVPNSKVPATKDKFDTDFPDAVMLSSYDDDPTDEPLGYFQDMRRPDPTLPGRQRPPYHGLNDCTHFTSECLIKGGFPVTNEHARRGAPDLYQYLYHHASTKVLASEVGTTDAGIVISAGLLKQGDVIVFTNQSDHQRHHGVVYLGGGKIAMHTFHQFNRDWAEAGGSDQLYSLFHISLDDVYTPWAISRWVGWWQITGGADVRYSYLSDNGHMFTTKTKPSSTDHKPKGSDYWFADATKMRTCLRTKGIVEEFSMDATTAAAGTVTAKGSVLNSGSLLSATKL